MAKIIEDYPDYTIERNGVVMKKDKVMATHINVQTGYVIVTLTQSVGVKSNKAIHRLLAEAFVENPLRKEQVNHIDGVKTNNSLDNLEWATRSENIQHAYDNGLVAYKRHYSMKDYEDFLTEDFLSGTTITALSIRLQYSLTQLSYHLREAAENLGILDKYEAELKRQDSILRISNGLKHRKICKLFQIDIQTGKTLHTYTSLAEATKALEKKSSGPISNAVSGRAKTAYGFKWVKQNLNDYPAGE